MNAIKNMLFLIIVFIFMIALAFAFSIGDEVLNAVHTVTFLYPTSHTMFLNSIKIRDFFLNMSLNIFLPFIVFMTLFSTFINRNNNILSYVLQCLGVLMITPLVLYFVPDIFTAILSTPIINTAYYKSIYFTNFTSLIIINLLLAFASFIFIRRGVQYEIA